MRFMCELHSDGILPIASNSSFISLIVKVENPIGFVPSSLVGYIYIKSYLMY